MMMFSPKKLSVLIGFSDEQKNEILNRADAIGKESRKHLLIASLSGLAVFSSLVLAYILKEKTVEYSLIWALISMDILYVLIYFSYKIFYINCVLPKKILKILDSYKL